MPGGALPGSAFLHQHMIVVEPHLRRPHQRRGDLRHAGVAGQPLDLRDVLPAAEVLSERTGITQAARHLGQRAGSGQHDLDRGDRSGYLGRVQDAAPASDAVARESSGQFPVRLSQVHGYLLLLAVATVWPIRTVPPGTPQSQTPGAAPIG